MPSSLPLVQTLLARNARFFSPRSSNTSPTVVSERPYIGEESITLPPASNSVRTTWTSAARSEVSKVRQVPIPITGSCSPVLGMGRVRMPAADTGPPTTSAAPETPACSSCLRESIIATFSPRRGNGARTPAGRKCRSEEHTSELQSHLNLVCRLLLEKKKKKIIICPLSKKKKKINNQ